MFDDRLVLKVFRKLEPGINPELEMLRFLTEHRFESIAPLHGWYEYEGQALSATLGVVQEFLAGRPRRLGAGARRDRVRPDMFLDRLGGLGHVTAEMHNVLASDPGDPAFSPEEPSQEAMSLLTATIDEDIERVFVRLPDDERVADDRGSRAGRPRAARGSGADRRRRPRDPHPRRLPPRPDPVHRTAAG